MESLVTWFAANLEPYVSKEVIVFLISMIPILELRGGLLASKLLGVSLFKAVPICVIGNIIPIPFILLFINKIFQWLKKVPLFKPFIERLESRAMKKSGGMEAKEFVGLMLFVGIPLPGTGAWTGSLIAALLEIDFKKAIISVLCGIVIATVIMSFLSYGLLGLFI